MSMRTLFVLAVALTAVQLVEAGSLNDVEHVIIWMQENRPFDQYYGLLAGVRGFNDRSSPVLPSGRPPFYQPLNNMGPTAENCYGSVCYVQDQVCPVGTPGAGGEGNRCCAGVWTSGTAACPALPNATDCQGQLCPVPDQICPVGVSGAGDNGKRCCNGNWREGTDACTEPAYMLPWHVDTFATSGTCMNSPGMGYGQDISMWNEGRMDGWCTARAPGFGWGYFDRGDLAYYYALADGFLVGDQYFQSTFTATDPNREHLFSGTNNNIRTYQKTNQTLRQMLDDSEPGLTWETMGETLEKAGISWRVFQEEDNFDDNGFAWFDNFRNAKPGDPLWDKGMARVPAGGLATALAEAFANKSLPQVSFVVGPTWRSEHSNNHPQDGEDQTAQLLKVLADPANAEMYAKTAFFFNYDEGGQYIDHHWTPTPPRSDKEGISTVDTLGELTVEAAEGIQPGNPMGLGFRVPFMIISPWTRGPIVYSGVADHTSVLKFVERRFNVTCPNITPWRRAITTDLVDAFDWNNPNYTWPSLPDTSTYPNETKRECDQLPLPKVPEVQSMPIQEWGVRISRALPYCHAISSSVENSEGSDRLVLRMENCGTAGNVFNVHDRAQPSSQPRPYTIEAGKVVTDAVWPSPTTALVADDEYYQSLHGPNGFVREFGGEATLKVQDKTLVAVVSAPATEAVLQYDVANKAVLVQMSTSSSSASCTLFTVSDRSYNTGGPWSFKVNAGDTATSKHMVQAQGNWYDLAVSASDCATPDKVVVFRGFKGRMETGEDTTSDPAMGLPSEEFVASVTSEVHPHLRPEQYLTAKDLLRSNTDMNAPDPAPVCTPGAEGYSKDMCTKAGHEEL